LVTGASTEFFDDFEDAPKTEDNHYTSSFLKHALETHIDGEAYQDNRGIEAVEFGFEESLEVFSIAS